jgi:hypothetical protein
MQEFVTTHIHADDRHGNMMLQPYLKQREELAIYQHENSGYYLKAYGKWSIRCNYNTYATHCPVPGVTTLQAVSGGVSISAFRELAITILR